MPLVGSVGFERALLRAFWKPSNGLVPPDPDANRAPRPAICCNGEAEYAPGSGPLYSCDVEVGTV